MKKYWLAKDLFVFLVLLVLVFLPSACLKINQLASNSNISESPQKILSEEELEDKYQVSVQEIMAPYWQSGEVNGLKDKVLALHVPGKYLDLHFNLVIALELIEQGQRDSDQEKIDNGKEKIAELKNEYDWLVKN